MVGRRSGDGLTEAMQSVQDIQTSKVGIDSGTGARIPVCTYEAVQNFILRSLGVLQIGSRTARQAGSAG